MRQYQKQNRFKSKAFQALLEIKASAVINVMLTNVYKILIYKQSENFGFNSNHNMII